MSEADLLLTTRQLQNWLKVDRITIRPLTPIAHSCRFCNLILDRKAGQQRCAAFWRAASLSPGGIPQLVTCHAALGYLWGRIEVQGRFVAAVHAGQFLDAAAEAEEWSTRLKEISTSTGVSQHDLRQALVEIPVLDDHRRRRIPCLLQQIASTLSEIGKDRLELLGRLVRIAEISTDALDDSQGRM